jgi:transcriptional regulator with XRE-family HTH domain
VSEETIHERLRRIRLERGESLNMLAQQTGLRVDWIQAIEEGRFGDLPTGIYGRSAVRRHSGSLGLDPDEVLAFCAPLLPDVEDPIYALGRLRGLPAPRGRTSHESPSHRAGAPAPVEARLLKPPSDLPSWRLLAASAVDAFAVVGLLVLVVTCTVASGVPISGLGQTAAPAFALLTFVLGGCYFVVLGGLVGATVGELAVNAHPPAVESSPLDLRSVMLRTMQCVLRDVYFIELLGEWIGRFFAQHRWPGGMNQTHVERPAA